MAEQQTEPQAIDACHAGASAGACSANNPWHAVFVSVSVAVAVVCGFRALSGTFYGAWLTK